MAAIMGKQGEFLFDVGGAAAALVIKIDTWSLECAPDIIDVTEFAVGTTYGKSFAYGLFTGRGSASGTLDLGAGEQLDTIDFITDAASYPAEGGTYPVFTFNYNDVSDCSGDCLIERVTTGATVAGKQTFAMDFVVNGLVSWTAA